MVRRQVSATAGGMFLLATALCTVVAVQTVDNSGNGAAAAGSTTPSAEVAELIPILDDPATPADKLPSFLSRGPQILQDSVPQSARFLGVELGVRYWTALNTDGEVCLIALLPGKAESAAMSCASAQDLLDEGLGLQVSDADVAVRAFVVPDDYIPAAPGFDKLDRNLIAEPATSDMAPTVLEPRDDTSTSDPIDLTHFDAASDSDSEG